MPYTLKEAAKKINVPSGTIRQWERELADILMIPRSKQGARIYTNTEIQLLIEIKKMYAEKINKALIRKWLENKLKPESETGSPLNEPPLEIVSAPPLPVPIEESAMKNTDHFFEAMDTYKQTFLNEVKNEIRSVVRKEVLDEIKKEISKGTFITVKSMSDSIYKSAANTKAELQELTDAIEKSTEHTAESLQYLSKSIANVSLETTEEIFTLSKQLSENREVMSQYADTTNNGIYNLAEAILKDREHFVEEREQYRYEIRQREAAFQNMLASFRDVAAAKEKKWWKFWS